MLEIYMCIYVYEHIKINVKIFKKIQPDIL